MKRCPKCNRVETDDTLGFCRADGTALVSDSLSVRTGSGPAFESANASTEIETSILPHSTDAGISRSTSATTVFEAQPALAGTQKLASGKHGKAIALTAAGLTLVALALLVYFYRTRNGNTAIDSIAVLPFANTNADPNTEFLSDGITESLINSLSQLPNVRVLARSTVFRFKGTDADPRAVGKQLGVDTVLTGRVVQAGENLSVQAELVNAADGSQVWGERYNRKAADILAVQEDITREIVGRLRPKLSGEQQERVTRRGTENAEAYKLYLQGRYFWNRRSAEDFKIAIPFFQKAIELDPDFALAHSGLSDSYNLLGQYIGGAPPKEVMPLAKKAALKALSLDESLAEAHGSLGQYLIEYEYDWAGAEREFKRAIELNPNYASAYQWHAELRMWEGRFEEAQAQARRAVELDPLSRIINSELARIALFARRYDEAITIFKKNIELNPDWHGDYNYLWYAYAAKGMYAEAVDSYLKLMTFAKLAPPSEVQATQESFARSGWQGFLRHRVRYLEQSSRHEYVSPADLAELYAYLGEKDKAFASLEKAYEMRVGDLKELKHKSSFDNLRDDPRFSDILRRVGLAH